MQAIKLGRFGHHPDPTNDFCVEVEEIQAEALNLQLGFADVDGGVLFARIARAMSFTVGGDEIAVRAKAELRNIKATVDAWLRSFEERE